MLRIHDLTHQEVIQVLAEANILVSVLNNEYKTIFGFQHSLAQSLINKYYFNKQEVMKNLVPVQFYFLLAKSGLDDVINNLLEALKTTDIDKYAMYKAYLNGARFYEFTKAVDMYTELKTQIIAIDPTLDFDLEQLKAMWREAANI